VLAGAGMLSPQGRGRAEREARALARLDHPHVVRIHAALEVEGMPVIVMEWIEGQTLQTRLDSGPLAADAAAAIAASLARALAAVHAVGIVHRDLKPANVLLEDCGDGKVNAKIVDFGISKILDKKLLGEGDRPAEMTSAFTMLGSPRYMAPEQVRNSKDVDARADLWSVGAVLFQLITGKHAFSAATNVEASIAVLTAEPQKLCALEPTAPAGLEEVIRRCLTRDVAARFQSARDVAEALRPFGSAA